MRLFGARRGLLVALAATSVVSAGGMSARAQGPRPMTLNDLVSIPRISDVQLSPDGRFVSYMLARVDWKADLLVPHIWRQAVSGGPPLQLTHGAGEALARWSPDSKRLLYFFRGQLFVVAADGGEPRQLTHHATNVLPPPPGVAISGFTWAPDGSSVYFVAKDAPRAESGGARPSPLVIFEESDVAQQHVWKVDVSTGAEQRITSGDWSVLPGIRLSRDGRHMVILRAPTSLTIDHYQSEIWVLDLDTGSLHQVTKNGIYETEAELSPDNSQVLFISDANQDLDVYYGAALFVVNASGGKPRLVSPNFKYTLEEATWSPDGQAILAVANMGVHNEIFRIDVRTGRARALTDGPHALIFFSVVPSANRMAFQIDEATRLGDAWTVPIDGGALTRVTGIYDSLARDWAFPRQEKVSWKGADGTPLEGILFYPNGYQPGKRYPLVVQLHGGPPQSDKFGLGAGVIFSYVPVLTGKGYAVFRPNYRGSAGYGPDFIRDIVGHYFNNMHLDVMAGVDFLIKQGIVDPDRLSIAGWSAGAHLVNKLITFTDRFKAASSGAGVANWISMMAQTDALTRRTYYFRGNPWQKNAPIDELWGQSPIKDVSRVKTPTIFFAGDKDTRVPQAQALEMYRGLEANGVPTRLIIGPGEDHDWTVGPLRNQLAKASMELAWFEKYVEGRAYEPEEFPSAQTASR
jgi:dipeptidyl aminopeptidase/acylaminoacyl peptidase